MREDKNYGTRARYTEKEIKIMRCEKWKKRNLC